MEAFGIFLMVLGLWMIWFALSRTVKAFAYSRTGGGCLTAIAVAALLLALVSYLLR
jgi:Co/Zn/Cd efflux system component